MEWQLYLMKGGQGVRADLARHVLWESTVTENKIVGRMRMLEETNLCLFSHTHHTIVEVEPDKKPWRQVDVPASKADDPIGTAPVTTAALEVHAIDVNSIKTRSSTSQMCAYGTNQPMVE